MTMQKDVAYWLKPAEFEEAIRDYIKKHGENGRIKELRFRSDACEDRDGEYYILFSNQPRPRDDL
jgi:hypothetical protein